MMMQLWEILLNWRQVLEIIILFAIIYLVLYYSSKNHGAKMMQVLVVLLLAIWGLARIIELPVITKLFALYPKAPHSPRNSLAGP